LGIWVNLAIVAVPYLISLIPAFSKLPYTELNFMAYIIISSIQLGATVDYAIIVTTKFKESIKTMTLKDAIKDMIYRSSPSVLVSASIIVFCCISVNLVTTNIIVAQITELIARGAIISAFLVLFLLPAIFTLYKKKYPDDRLLVSAEEPAEAAASAANEPIANEPAINAAANEPSEGTPQ
jgi:predicted RND superfamily exporter protein